MLGDMGEAEGFFCKGLGGLRSVVEWIFRGVLRKMIGSQALNKIGHDKFT